MPTLTVTAKLGNLVSTGQTNHMSNLGRKETAEKIGGNKVAIFDHILVFVIVYQWVTSQDCDMVKVGFGTVFECRQC